MWVYLQEKKAGIKTIDFSVGSNQGQLKVNEKPDYNFDKNKKIKFEKL